MLTSKTVTSKAVVNLQYAPLNSLGNKVTCPWKGAVVVRDNPLKIESFIWDEEGNLYGWNEYVSIWPHQVKNRDNNKLVISPEMAELTKRSVR